jgi:tetratricopeptide (TPR) repeat protein
VDEFHYTWVISAFIRKTCPYWRFAILPLDAFLDRLKSLYRAGDPQQIEAYLLAEIAATGGDQRSLCTLYNELGGYYRGVSRYRDSLDAFDRADGCLEGCGLALTIQAATVMINRAGTCRLMGDPAAALELYRRASAILDAHPEADPYLVASLNNNLALSYIDSGDLEEALAQAQKGCEIVMAIPGAQHAQATALVNLASISFQAGDLAAAEAQVGRAMGIFECMPSSNPHYAAALNLQANIRARRGNYAGAREALLQALEYTRYFFGENIEAASTLQSLAQVCSALGEDADACRWQQTAVENMQRLLGDEDARTAASRRLLAHYLARV